MPATLTPILRDAALITAFSALLALGFNALRTEGLPLIADKPYDILVPCPEPVGEVAAVTPDAPEVKAPDTLLIDARDEDAFKAWHLPGAHHVEYDYLTEMSAADEATIRALLASRARRVIVYGDGDDPDSGRMLGSDLHLKGMKNVSFVTGGAPALRVPTLDRGAAGGAP
jgi:hypothetical protein